MKHSPSQIQSLTLRVPWAPAALDLFERLSQGRSDDTMLFESAEPTSRRSQRSIVVCGAPLRIRSAGDCVTVEGVSASGRQCLATIEQALLKHGFAFDRTESVLTIQVPVASRASIVTEEQRLRQLSSLSVLRVIRETLSPKPSTGPYAVFLCGLFAYDLIDQFEDLPAALPHTPAEHGPALPDFHVVLADRLVVIDHLSGTSQIVVNMLPGHDGDQAHQEAVAAINHVRDVVLSIPDAPAAMVSPSSRGALSDIQPHGVRTCTSDDDFSTLVKTAQQHIERGDVFQIVPSRSFTLPCPDPLAAYRALRSVNPSPYMFYLRLGDVTVFGASPESAVTVDGATRTVEISPIAGTQPRGKRPDGTIDPDLDGRLEAHLRLDPKETAEHMMLVDLARNDIARVSETGTRHVSQLLRVDRYSHVMHLVSRVTGTLRPDLDALHAYQASLNMGTLTGAPKVRAMQLIRSFEGTKRGAYGGAVGYFDALGNFDTAIVIRSAVVHGDQAWVRAGAGVVMGSVPMSETQETTNKAMAVLRAIAVSQAPGQDGACHD